MSRYDKRIVYFDFMEQEEKIGNGGFAKVIVQNGQMRLIVNINGLHNKSTVGATLVLYQQEKEVLLDSLFIKDGRCVYSRLFSMEEMQAIGIIWEETYGLCVNLEDGSYLKAMWGEKQEKKHQVEIQENADTRKKETVNEEPVVDEGREIKSVADVVEVAETMTFEPAADTTVEYKTEVKEIPGKIHDDKWKQLEQIYPHIHPFGDEREYLSVTPKDYIVLTREYQNLANNSFLLHGFYNYHHTILGKVSGERKEEEYYLGVPGVFYEREKAVAIMFGFESFECANEPAQTGTFGYYMKRVEI